MLHSQALRGKFGRGHAATIAAEVEPMVADWGEEGEIDLLEWPAEPRCPTHALSIEED